MMKTPEAEFVHEPDLQYHTQLPGQETLKPQ